GSPSATHASPLTVLPSAPLGTDSPRRPEQHVHQSWGDVLRRDPPVQRGWSGRQGGAGRLAGQRRRCCNRLDRQARSALLRRSLSGSSVLAPDKRSRPPPITPRTIRLTPRFVRS